MDLKKKLYKKKIFITNDDGINSKGIKVLKDISKDIFSDIYTIAPEKNQSGKSHSITINKFIKVKKKNDREFVVEGTPVDCVVVGLKNIFSPKIRPALLLSGINIGVNMGLDIYYSGTVSAAREGCMNGLKSIAISIEKNKKKLEWSGIKFFLPKLIGFILSEDINNSYFYNINFPNIPWKNIKGIKLTKSGFRKPGSVTLMKARGSNIFIKIPSERKIIKKAIIGEDEYELHKGYISLSIHRVDLACTLEIEKKIKSALGKIFEK